ncbi:putative peptidoglycan bound protein [Listeria monocytogenes]|nr:putative peptidoglycan bound protein [Listeria monocytogenes]
MTDTIQFISPVAGFHLPTFPPLAKILVSGVASAFIVSEYWVKLPSKYENEALLSSVFAPSVKSIFVFIFTTILLSVVA